jgi:glc operon protein GlcG
MTMSLRTSVALALATFATATVAAEELPTKRVLTLAAATRVAQAAEVEASKRGATIVIAVVDDGGSLVVLHRLDETQVASVEVGIGKARTAALLKKPTSAPSFTVAVEKGEPVRHQFAFSGIAYP